MPPKIIFIVPYRHRIQHLTHFRQYMKHILEDVSDYKIYIAHQDDTRTFNRGAVKNIGFLAMKQLYPNDYKNITFVFNDVDTMPFTKNIINYNTTPGIIKHFYGFKNALGGIFSIKGGDFEKIKGFPNFWSWGGEDNEIHHRAVQSGLKIDRSVFYPLDNPNILQFYDGMTKALNRKELKAVGIKDNNLTSLYNIKCVIKGDWINIKQFEAEYSDRKYQLEDVFLNDIADKLKDKKHRKVNLVMF